MHPILIDFIVMELSDSWQSLCCSHKLNMEDVEGSGQNLDLSRDM